MADAPSFEEVKPLLPDACRRWQVPAEFLRALQELREEAAVRFVRGAWAAGKRTIALIGPVGTGKTAAACVPLLTHWQVMRPYLRTPGDMAPILRPRPAFFLDMAEASAWSLWDKDDERMRDRALSTELLILDDLGRERGDGAAVLEAIINSRNAAERRTVLTSNLGPREFAERYGARILDRLRGDGAAFQATGPSLRGKLVGADLAQPRETETA